MSIIWGSLKREKSGEWEGLNNAAIYTFNSNIINSFVREMFQNSIDARIKPKDSGTGRVPPLKIRVSYDYLSQDEFPDFKGFWEILRMISAAAPNKKHGIFFKHAFSVLMQNKKRIPVFIFEDYNTTGLDGDDDDPGKSFNACVVSEGLSIKSDANAGGSFGIGKNAIYGLSQVRTVFYVSRDGKGKYIFQGKAKLASYYDARSRTRDSKIYFGKGSTLSSVRTHRDLPEPVRSRFERKEPGLSQYAVCPVDNADWPEEFARAILRNYWMLLEKGELSVELCRGSEVVYSLARKNLEELLMKFFDPATYEPDDVRPEGNPFEFYKCFKEGTLHSASLPRFGKIRFYYREIDNKSTNAVAYLRNDMVVHTKGVHGFGAIGYCGVFICDDTMGNEILRAMEPPTHDSFDAARIAERMEGYTAKAGQAILGEIKTIIRNALQEILDKYYKPSERIAWIDEIFSSLKGVAGQGGGDRSNAATPDETPERINAATENTLVFDSVNRNTQVSHTSGTAEDQNGGGGKGGGGGAKGGGGGGIQKKRKGPGQSERIKSRVFRTNRAKAFNGKDHIAYRVFLECKESLKATSVIMSQHGDSGRAAVFEIGGVFSSDGSAVTFREQKDEKAQVVGYRIEGLEIPCSLDVFVNEPYKSSFEIVGG